MEDIAYCLLRISDVSMSILYGEGKKSFVRLQEEIAKGANSIGFQPNQAFFLKRYGSSAITFGFS